MRRRSWCLVGRAVELRGSHGVFTIIGTRVGDEEREEIHSGSIYLAALLEADLAQ